MNEIVQRETQTKLTKNLLDMIILRLINQQPMHGYQIMTKIRRIFGVYFGPSAIYPLLAKLEEQGYINSKWNIPLLEKPCKIFTITNTGKTMIKYTENTLDIFCRTLKTFEKTTQNTPPPPTPLPITTPTTPVLTTTLSP
ncbi:MAG: PadR family transcriptional regulator [Nitrososphaerota archaeon]|jgi:DNA-binding PadR family transcriptional regulator|nr:PadR family transcriptional regulator [Nitrososphaerota archaeon]